MVQRPEAILIAGPTASGKSQYALELANRWDGEIINTDSMQIYPVLRVLTARPDESDLVQVPHHLYGYAPVDEAYSVARWLADATRAAEDIWRRGKVPIFVGGTGLYFKAVDQGLAETPEIPASIRQSVRQAMDAYGSVALHAQLAELDPTEAQRLRPGDTHRITRALEVIKATGKPLTYFHDQPVSETLTGNKSVQRVVLMPPRPLLHQRINRRAELMMQGGAVDEVKALLKLELPRHATLLKAIGVQQIENYISGKSTLNECVDRLKAATRQYSKRQSTWFRGQFDDRWSHIVPL